VLIQTAPALKAVTLHPGYLRAKRIFDVIFTLLILLPLCICVAVVAFLIRWDSKGPVFYRQRRVGLNGVEFDMFKFRSMYENCDEAAHRRAVVQYMNGKKLNDNEGGDMPYKQVDDPRITRIGRFIRKTSIDELPQFFNVLRGEMTLVGPRPPLPYEVELYTMHDRLRLSGKPGLTGTWQVYGRSRVTFKGMVEMDIDYLEHPSFWGDLKLIALTIPVMIQSRGGA
jgi:lipopolysaccharide/colanic/teichoic acid biosynthesis glycosyltransferase